LYPYQEAPVEKLISRGSLLLAFGCGVGKTLISIAAAERLMEENYVSLSLIFCPASLKYQWEARVNEFTDSSVQVIEGNKETREKQYSDSNADYIIASYDSAVYDYELLSKLTPDFVICDEVSAIKSFRALRSKRIKKLFSKVPFRLGLTATPIENKPDELFSLMQWVDASVLGRYDLFDKAYITRNANGWVTSYKNLDVLNQRLGDSMMRKTRHDPEVRPYLPDVDEDNWTVPMPPKVKSAYKIIARDMLDEMRNLDVFSNFDVHSYSKGEDEGSAPGRLMAMHMCLEMMLDHPELVYWSASEYAKDSPNGSAYAAHLTDTKILDGIKESQKLRVLKAELELILADPDSKVLVYSKYKPMLRLIADYLPWKSVFYDGDLSAKEKNDVIQRFTADKDIKLFLSSYAGGYGLDMNMADVLINFDLPWSFGAQDQVNSRHIRASSVFGKVYIRNLITENSIEERKFRILARKRRMSEIAIDGAAGSSTVEMSDDTLRSHLENFG
jgi:SNF2 family DNA or RNA helicase